MQFDTKIAVIVRSDLLPWQSLNVTSFLSGGLVGASPMLAGEVYRDASGAVYGPLIRQPVLIFAGDLSALRTAADRAAGRGLTPSIYTSALFTTNHDAANRAAVAEVQTADLDLVGLAVHGPRKDVDKVVKGLRLHP